METYPIGFKIYYYDDSVYCGKGSKEELYKYWTSAANTGIQAILIYENTLDYFGKHTRIIMSGCDYYFYDGIEFGASFNNIDMCKGHILYGTWVSDSKYDEIINIAIMDHNI